MKIELLQGMDGFSRVSPQPTRSLNGGFSRVNYMNGYQLNAGARRGFKSVPATRRPLTAQQVRNLATPGINGYTLDGDYFLDFDIDPSTLQGRKERKARRAARRGQRAQRKAEKAAKRQERQAQKARRQEARTVRKEKRATRGDDRRAARLARQQARQDARTERRRLREERKAGQPGFGDTLANVASMAVDTFGSGGGIADFAGDFIETLPPAIQDRAFDLADQFGISPNEAAFDMQQRGMDIEDFGDDRGSGTWWSKQDTMTKGLIIGGGVLGAYFLAKQAGLIGDNKKKKK